MMHRLIVIVLLVLNVCGQLSAAQAPVPDLTPGQRLFSVSSPASFAAALTAPGVLLVTTPFVGEKNESNEYAVVNNTLVTVPVFDSAGDLILASGSFYFADGRRAGSTRSRFVGYVSTPLVNPPPMWPWVFMVNAVYESSDRGAPTLADVAYNTAKVIVDSQRATHALNEDHRKRREAWFKSCQAEWSERLRQDPSYNPFCEAITTHPARTQQSSKAVRPAGMSECLLCVPEGAGILASDVESGVELTVTAVEQNSSAIETVSAGSVSSTQHEASSTAAMSLCSSIVSTGSALSVSDSEPVAAEILSAGQTTPLRSVAAGAGVAPAEHLSAPRVNDGACGAGHKTGHKKKKGSRVPHVTGAVTGSAVGLKTMPVTFTATQERLATEVKAAEARRRKIEERKAHEEHVAEAARIKAEEDRAAAEQRKALQKTRRLEAKRGAYSAAQAKEEEENELLAQAAAEACAMEVDYSKKPIDELLFSLEGVVPVKRLVSVFAELTKRAGKKSLRDGVRVQEWLYLVAEGLTSELFAQGLVSESFEKLMIARSRLDATDLHEHDVIESIIGTCKKLYEAIDAARFLDVPAMSQLFELHGAIIAEKKQTTVLDGHVTHFMEVVKDVIDCVYTIFKLNQTIEQWSSEATVAVNEIWNCRTYETFYNEEISKSDMPLTAIFFRKRDIDKCYRFLQARIDQAVVMHRQCGRTAATAAGAGLSVSPVSYESLVALSKRIGKYLTAVTALNEHFTRFVAGSPGADVCAATMAVVRAADYSADAFHDKMAFSSFLSRAMDARFATDPSRETFQAKRFFAGLSSTLHAASYNVFKEALRAIIKVDHSSDASYGGAIDRLAKAFIMNGINANFEKHHACAYLSLMIHPLAPCSLKDIDAIMGVLCDIHASYRKQFSQLAEEFKDAKAYLETDSCFTKVITTFIRARGATACAEWASLLRNSGVVWVVGSLGWPKSPKVHKEYLAHILKTASLTYHMSGLCMNPELENLADFIGLYRHYDQLIKGSDFKAMLHDVIMDEIKAMREGKEVNGLMLAFLPSYVTTLEAAESFLRIGGYSADQHSNTEKKALATYAGFAGVGAIRRHGAAAAGAGKVA